MSQETFNSIKTAVLANKVDGIVREMTNTMLRSARSAVINSARDFSCAITTGDSQLLACAEGLPVHIFGSQLQAAALKEAHPNMREGDAYLDNDPYKGNSHAADHTILVPVFVEGEHLFTAVAKAHQADIGNSIPSTYHAAAKDVYEEGALIFPTVQVQRDYTDIDDIVRMCKARIRVPAQWHGDYLAMIGSARIAERRLKEMVDKYGLDTIKQFVRDWLDYSESCMAKAIEALPKATLQFSGTHDPYLPYLPEGLPFQGTMIIAPEDGRITVDMTDNIDNVDCGLNLTQATTLAGVFAGVYNAIEAKVPKNSGAFRRVEVLLKEGAAVGIPKFPHSCSLATTDVSDRLINAVGSAFAQLGAPYGIAEGATGQNVANAVVSGVDSRTGEDFINQTVMCVNGGPASPQADGWVTWGLPCVGGLMYRDSIEIDELKLPVRYEYMRAMPDSGGAGAHRGGPSFQYAVTPISDPVTFIYHCDAQINPVKGVAGGHNGALAASWLEAADGSRTKTSNTEIIDLQFGQTLHASDASGGGYGNPLERDPHAVLADVIEGWETIEHAKEVYQVAIVNTPDGLTIDHKVTTAWREKAHLA